MFVHEYQAKSLLAEHGLSFIPGAVANSAEEAAAAAESIQSDFWVVKAQILAGDRGRFGGVKIARSVAEVATLTRSMLGSTLVTTQTGESGLPVRQVYVEQGCSISKELYIALIVDRAAGELVLLACVAGGSGIEEKNASEFLRLPVSIESTPTKEELRQVGTYLNLVDAHTESLSEICQKMYFALIKLDALAIELNPLALTNEGELTGLDVKLELDDNAFFRHENHAKLRSKEDDPNRVARSEAGYNYAPLSGDIGLLVGGAGLALATMDLVNLHGGSPANFLDLPPVATSATVADACRTILRNSDLKALFVNVVGGGLTHCDTVAEGLIAVHKESGISCPIVIRLAGTSKDHAVVLLRNAGVPFVLARSLQDAINQLMRITSN